MILMCRRHGGCDKTLLYKTKGTSRQRTEAVIFDNTGARSEIPGRVNSGDSVGEQYEDLRGRVRSSSHIRGGGAEEEEEEEDDE